MEKLENTLSQVAKLCLTPNGNQVSCFAHCVFRDVWGSHPEASLVPVKGLEDKKIVQVACGQQHTIALDETGWVLSCDDVRGAQGF